MLFATIYTSRGDGSEERDKRTLQLFKNWNPPAAFQIKSFYDFADGSGGIVISETDSAAAILEAVAPWLPYNNFKVVPIVDTTESTPIFERGAAWRESIR